MNDDTHIRLALVEREQEVQQAQLKSGANTFSKLRATVMASVLSGLFAAGGMIWQAATRVAEAEATKEQAKETQKLVTEVRSELQSIQLKLGTVETMLRVEADRRADLERQVQTLSARRPR